MVIGKTLEVTNGFRSVHTDFTNNNERDGFDVFYDDAVFIQPPLRQLTDDQLLDELAAEKQVRRV